MKKRALAIVLATAVLVTLVLATFTASAAPQVLADYESYTLSQADTENGFSLETTAPISGTKSLAYHLEGAGFGWLWNTKLGIESADWSGYDYLGIKVKNTSTTHAVGISFLIDMKTSADALCRYIPTAGGGLILADADEENVSAAKMVPSTTNGVGCPYAELAPGFTGTLYIPLKVNAAFENSAFTSSNAPYNNVTGLPLSLQAAADYNGNVLFDDAALYLAADVPAIVYKPILLTDYESNSAASEVINGIVPDDGTMSCEIVTTGALNGSKSLAFNLDPQGASVGTGNVYMQAIGGATSYANYGYLSIRMKNTDTANDVEINFMLDDAGYNPDNRQTLTSSANSVIMRTADNYAVETVFSEDIYLNIPAGFDGTVYFPVAEDTTISEMYMRLRPHEGGDYSGKLLWDDPTLLNEDDIPAAEVEDTATQGPSASAPAASSTNGPGDAGNTGSALMLMPAIAAAAAAVVALRKRKA